MSYISERTKLIERLLKVSKKKDKHLDDYRKFLDNLAEQKSNMIFYQGDCRECAGYESEMKSLIKQIEEKI